MTFTSMHTIRPRNIAVAFTFLIGTQLFKEGNCRAIYSEGSTTETEVTHFEFIQRLGNPCGIEHIERPSAAASGYVTIQETLDPTIFYQSMLIAVDQGLQKLQRFEDANPNLPKCEGGNLDSLPPIQSLEDVDETQLFKEIYTSGIFLAANFHIMGLDRQLSFVGVNDLRDEDVDEHEDIPSWRILRCGNESESFIPSIQTLTMQMESILCTVVSSANLQQRASFRQPFDRLTNTTFYRYHSSCSTLQTRDCLVLREAKNALTTIAAKFNSLLNEVDTISIGGMEESHHLSAYTLV